MDWWWRNCCRFQDLPPDLFTESSLADDPGARKTNTTTTHTTTCLPKPAIHAIQPASTYTSESKKELSYAHTL